MGRQEDHEKYLIAAKKDLSSKMGKGSLQSHAC